MEVNDTIRFLNAVGGGVVKRLDHAKQIAWVEDESGFEVPTPFNQCVVVSTQSNEDEYRQRSFLLGRKGPSQQQMAAKQAAKTAAPMTANGKKEPKQDEQMIVDLHIEKITNRTDLPTAEILQLQIATFRRIMLAEKRNRGRQIIFIHGKGEGVLRQNIEKILRQEFQSCRFLDANYGKFSTGAILVLIN